MKVQDFYPSKSFSAQVQTLRKFIHDALGWHYDFADALRAMPLLIRVLS